MGEKEAITVGEESAGDAAGSAVDLPVVDVLTGRGFVTGKSGSGKSNTASVVAEKLLDRGYSMLVVDIDGEYYGLKEEYEILHVGADDECDLQVGVEHAEKLATLALQKGVPIILDVSSFLDERDARELLKEVAKQLFAKEKKVKQPFLMLVEEVHEFIPEGAGMDECGRMLVKVGKRGRKHGLGVVGISQRPADVKKDFITQCDWLVWHRLTWSNDTKVAGRILGSEFRDPVEDLGDGEAFVMCDWSDRIRRVQFERKRTFDAGATPGLDDFERPELKSVSDDLVGDLHEITEARQQRESRIQELERQLKDREQRIEELEAELEEARDLSAMAEQFSRAMMEHAAGRPFRTDVTGYEAGLDDLPGDTARQRPSSGSDVPTGSAGDGATDTTSTVTGSADPCDDDPHAGGAPVAEDFGAGRMAAMAAAATETEADGGERADATESSPDGPASPDRRPACETVRNRVERLDDVTRGMLAYYREYGPASPVDAHVAAGGDADRTEAYRRNGRLREADLIDHAGRGTYTDRIRAAVAAARADDPSSEDLDAAVTAVEAALPPARSPETNGTAPGASEGA